MADRELTRKARCPVCHADLPFHSNANPGDISFCLGCGNISKYNQKMQLKTVTAQDVLCFSISEFQQAKSFNQRTRALRDGLNKQE